MKVYDISRELLGAAVFPGDPTPIIGKVLSIDKGDVCNLGTLNMCLHNGTHVDAPYHFLNGGNTVENMSLDSLVGYAYVVEFDGIISSDDVNKIVEKAEKSHTESAKRILIKGNAVISSEAAYDLVKSQALLIGTELYTVGSEKEIALVHNILLGGNVAILESICLDGIDEGVYILSAAPIKIKGADGSPCRATLISL